jgi:tetratricopeptide (TPR) repeat protein
MKQHQTNGSSNVNSVMRWKVLTLLGALGLSACGGAASGGAAGGKSTLPAQDRSGKTSAGGAEISKQAAQGYKQALDEFLKHDQAYDWAPATCKASADAFVGVSKKQESDAGKPLPEALYNAGLAYMRCGMEEDAFNQFQAASKAGQGFHRARSQMALFEYKKTGNVNAAISSLEQIIRDAKFQNVEALVSVAALQMERGNDVKDEDGANDFERAKKNIQRALAIDDSFMPAMNQLAIYYMEQAKRNAEGGEDQPQRRGRRGGLAVASATHARANRQQLELAWLVTNQGARIDPKYAPLYNTAGLIQVELHDYNGAVKSFGRARALDPNFFEAHMNYAAVSLSFRGFAEADKAYRDALRLEPKDYEAHLGLALALRGEINDSNYDATLAEAQKHLAECKQLDPNRVEAYYNEAILTQEYQAKGGDSAKTIPALKQAVVKYREFIAKAKGKGGYAEAVKRSGERAKDIEDTIKFIEEGEQLKKEQDEIDRKAAEAQQKQGGQPADGSAPAGDSSAPQQ